MDSSIVGPIHSSTQTAYPGSGLQNQFGSSASYTQALAQQAQQQQAFNQLAKDQEDRQDWRIDGKPMTMTEFANTLWPDTCAEKTMFYLRYSKDKK